jgi:hypothetical protein
LNVGLPLAMPLPAHKTQTQYINTQISMRLVGFESTTPVFEREKTVAWQIFIGYKINRKRKRKRREIEKEKVILEKKNWKGEEK